MHESRSARLTADERRSDIVEKATQLFAMKGFRGATTKEIADACGISEATIFRHFATKEDLYDAIIRSHMELSSHAELELAWTARGDDRAVFGTFARQFLRSHMSDPAFWRLLLYSGLEEHQLAGRFFAHYVREGRARAVAYIRARQREGAIRADLNPEHALSAFIGMLVNYVMSVQVFKQEDLWPTSIEEAADSIAELFVNGVRAVPCADA